MLTKHNPSNITPPLGRYAHGISIPQNARQLHLSGQVGVRPDGSVPDDCKSQIEVAWDNIVAIIESAGMTVADIVKVTTYLTRAEDFAVHPAVRDAYLQGHAAAATAMVVTALAKPEFLVEIDIIAAKAG